MLIALYCCRYHPKLILLPLLLLITALVCIIINNDFLMRGIFDVCVCAEEMRLTNLHYWFLYVPIFFFNVAFASAFSFTPLRLLFAIYSTFRFVSSCLIVLLLYLFRGRKKGHLVFFFLYFVG